MVRASELEARTLKYGRDIFARLDGAAAVPFSPAWFDDLLMGWTMGDEHLKVQLFRFVDVLPLLQSPAAITRHLREYFGEATENLPGWINLIVRHLPERGPLAWLVAAAARRGAERLARKFIAGSNLTEALQAVGRLRRNSLGFTVDLLGEATITEQEAEKEQAEYLDLVVGLSRAVNGWPQVQLIDADNKGPLPRVNVSVKLSALYSQFDPIDPR
jgi:RHH-type proline utilization regulon transcriptional repressor/proline dehydrogenase/delta 1-pyrroline-5-carboxylate dehydrogenase